MCFLILPVILWSPLEQYSELISSTCLLCEVGTSILVAVGWTDGHTHDNTPRLIHDVNTKGPVEKGDKSYFEKKGAKVCLYKIIFFLAFR